MQFEMKLKIGGKEITIRDEASSPADFIKKAAFYSSIPTTGPNGETDLVLTYRSPKGNDYYSIVSKEAGQEFKFGQFKDDKGALFAKDWEELYNYGGGESSSKSSSSGGGLGDDDEDEEVSYGLSEEEEEKPKKKSAPAKKAPAKKAAKKVEAEVEEEDEDVDDVLSQFGI